jgi:hypothetical protein
MEIAMKGKNEKTKYGLGLCGYKRPDTAVAVHNYLLYGRNSHL